MFDGGNNFNEKLVELVGKHRFLYDNTSEGYTNFQVQDEIWRKIATELREDVAACKLKWKNIRSCYTRYLRQVSSQNCRITRTYYLAKHLKFLLPFCRPNTRQVLSDSCSDENTILHYEDQDLEPVGKTEPIDEDESNSKLEPSVNLNEDNDETQISEENTSCKRQWETNGEYECCKRKRVDDNVDESELNFFKSLLPDIRKMNGKQKNGLKIAILNAIDSILYNDDKV
ncbi:hypothetical protein GEV33_000906 [Tenebrio molitor]|uniref:MADF domain-containing protein n=1 Tax=Tenebrio molitor TaxID=7067 RepID=A0A8J6LH78_TENMO|nr:hypothetical protein GEV33_000906 [Tenebrio molitor]